MKKAGKKLLWIAGILASLIIVSLMILILLYPAEYIFRVLRWNNADVYDYKKFPERLLEASPQAFFFEEALAEDYVENLFETNPTVDHLETFLVETGTQAFIVIQDDKILYEQYFNEANRDSIVTSFSMAKSFASALIGIAISEGHIKNVNDPITDYLPELAERDPAYNHITIRDLLLMSSGIEYEEFPFVNGDDAKTYYYPDLRSLALEQTQIKDPPGQYWLYNNYHPLLLGLIIERATGTKVTHYLQEKIWGPMGTEFDGSWSLDSDDTGFEKMESGINARAIDFAKFGRLYLKRGNWDGAQVIPAVWVRESTQPDITLDADSYYPADWFKLDDGEGYYKYMWWGIQRGDQSYDFMALGNHGQFIYVSPDKNLVIVRNGERYGIDMLEWLEIFYQFAGSIEEGNS
jgi:CubicO group peptidase (beta-lactamase class C family)